MDKQEDIISDFEELIKVKDFYAENKREPFEWTYQQILQSLKNEYVDNIDKKLERWINVSHVLYFKDVKPVTFYLQAKMLYRDGFYEAAIVVSRGICEMICYEMLLRLENPFGDYASIELENFRTLIRYLAIPKQINKESFEEQILNRITSVDDRNYINSIYQVSTTELKYIFKKETGRKAKNQNRILNIFESVGFDDLDNFSKSSYDLINEIYDNGNTYVHARKSPNIAKEDACTCLNNIGQILFELYGIKEPPLKRTIKTGYTDFPDICTGMNFALDAYLTPEAANRGYYNAPSQEQIDRLLATHGRWKVEWQSNGGNNYDGEINFIVDKDYIYAKMNYERDNQIETDAIEIKLFPNSFRIIEFDKKTSKHNSDKHIHFELEFFNENTLLGRDIINNEKVVLTRQL